MITYELKRPWLRDLKHVGTSWTLRRIIRAMPPRTPEPYSKFF